jgi:Putative MetA-pathway of phenol degradation
MMMGRIVLLGFLLSAPLAAQDFSGLPEPLDTDRPDFTEGTSTVPAGHYQLEGGYTFTRQGTDESQSLGELLLRIGVNERIEARLGIGSYDWDDPGVRGERRISGYEDPVLGLKIRLVPDDAKTQIALLLNTTVPVGSNELTADDWQPEGKLAMGWDLTDRFSLASMLVYTYASDGGERFSQFAASVSAAFSLTERWGYYLEGYGFSKESADGSTTTYLDSGLTYLLSKDVQFDVRVGAGLDSPHPNGYAGLGAAIRF